MVKADPKRPRWLDFTADLSRWAGPRGHPGVPRRPSTASHRSTATPTWWPGGPVRLSASDPAPRERPNVLFILVDTLRADHLTPYGYRRDTSPNLARAAGGQRRGGGDRLLAGAVDPPLGRLLHDQPPSRGDAWASDAATYGMPPGVPTLAEAMATRGYETGGFFANQVLHAGNGFARGFDTFFSPAGRARADRRRQPDAAGLTARVQPWLRGPPQRPFFLYVALRRSPRSVRESGDRGRPLPLRAPLPRPHLGPPRPGGLRGQDPAGRSGAGHRHLKALYDSEIHYADRFIGQLIDSLPPDVLRNTLIVLTADHGEEFHDHGGWKHGFTLYEEQIHVPLLVRWDGHVPAGSRLRGTVRLLDLAPTLWRAPGRRARPFLGRGRPPAGAAPARRPLPRLAAFAQHMMIGPLRAAAVLDGRKLILFNPRTAYAPANGLERLSLDAGPPAPAAGGAIRSLPRPGERRNLAASAPGEVERSSR